MNNKLYVVSHRFTNGVESKKRYVIESIEKALEKFVDDYPNYQISSVDEYNIDGEYLSSYSVVDLQKINEIKSVKEQAYPQSIVGLKVKIELLEKRLQEKENELAEYSTVGIGNVATSFSYASIGVFFGIAGFISMLVFLYFTFAKDSFNIISLFIIVICIFLVMHFNNKSQSNEEEYINKNRYVDPLRKQLEYEINEIITKIHKHESLLEQLVIKQETLENHVEITETKECPQCAEIIKSKAKICRYCNYQFINELMTQKDEN
jgi:hypothetical protein